MTNKERDMRKFYDKMGNLRDTSLGELNKADLFFLAQMHQVKLVSHIRKRRPNEDFTRAQVEHFIKAASSARGRI